MFSYHRREITLTDSDLSAARVHLKWIRSSLFSVLFAGFTGLCAQLRFYLPFTPVPVTGQVFAVLLAGLFLGRIYGPLSQIFYVTFGVAGIPWFAVGPLGPTGGYIAGFIIAPLITASLMDTLSSPRKINRHGRRHYPASDQGMHQHGINLQKSGNTLKFPALIAAMTLAVCTIYLFGLVQFSIYSGKSLTASLKFAVLPFIPFDMVKVILAASIGWVILRPGPPKA